MPTGAEILRTWPAARGAAATAGGGSADSGMPVMRYSTARSGLLNAARIARCTSPLSKPISTIYKR